MQQTITKTILVVDDSPAVRGLFRTVLRGDGYEIIECTNGVERMKALSGQEINIIMSDLNMPEMDGLTEPRRD
jgi:two-component system chemotaxis response regulator CheY